MRCRLSAISLHGEGGIRTPDRGISPYNGLANRRLQPLGHLSNDTRTSQVTEAGATPGCESSARALRRRVGVVLCAPLGLTNLVKSGSLWSSGLVSGCVLCAVARRRVGYGST